MDSVAIQKVSVLKSELWRMRTLGIVEKNEMVYKWIEHRIRALEEGI